MGLKIEKPPEKKKPQKKPKPKKKPEFNFAKPPEKKEPEFKFTKPPEVEKQVVKNEPTKPSFEAKPDALTFENAEEKAYYNVFVDFDYITAVFTSIDKRPPRVRFQGSAIVEKKIPEK